MCSGQKKNEVSDLSELDGDDLGCAADGEVRPVKQPRQRCPICSEDIDGSRLVLACQDCGTLHHVDCWLFNGGCAIFACNGIHAEDYWETQLAGDCSEVVESGGTMVPWLLAAPLVIWAAYVCNEAISQSFVREIGSFAYLACAAYLILVAWLLATELISTFRAFFFARVRFDRKKKVASRQWYAFGFPITAKNENWLRHKRVVEVHVHFPVSLGPGKEEVYLAFEDGTRYPLYVAELSSTSHKLPRIDILRLAENIAATFDCSVSIMRSLRAPSREEIIVLAANRDMGFVKGKLTERNGSKAAVPIVVKDKCVEEDKFRLRKRVEVKDCQACGKALAINVVQCKRCSALFHTGCWERAGVCPMPNCSGRVADSPQGGKLDFEQEYVNFTFYPKVQSSSETKLLNLVAWFTVVGFCVRVLLSRIESSVNPWDCSGFSFWS